MELPNELRFSILQEFPLDRLVELCQDPQLREMCNSSHFWKGKFHKEGLPLLMEGKDYSSWLSIFLWSQKVEESTERFMRRVEESLEREIKGELGLFHLDKINNPAYFFPLIPQLLEMFVVAWQGTLSEKFKEERDALEPFTVGENGEEVEEERNILERLDDVYTPLMAKSSSEGFCTFVFEKKRLELHFSSYANRTRKEYKLPISMENLAILVYKLLFFGVYIDVAA